MKKFYTAIPLQPMGELRSYQYQAMGNTKLQMEKDTRFPIVTAVNGYAQPGEEIRVIAVVQDTPPAHENLKLLEEELSALCCEKALNFRGVEAVVIPCDEWVSTHTAVFQKLIDLAEDGDELFACMTFGTKPLSMAVMMAVQYAYRVKANTSICCIVYGLIQRPERDPASWRGEVYDMTALVQMDEIVRLLAQRKVTDPKAAIDAILAL